MLQTDRSGTTWLCQKSGVRLVTVDTVARLFMGGRGITEIAIGYNIKREAVEDAVREGLKQQKRRERT